jgi:hypothetical protein
VCAELSQRINRLTTDSSGSCPRLETAFVSGNTVASAALRRRHEATPPSEFTIGVILSTNQESKAQI